MRVSHWSVLVLLLLLSVFPAAAQDDEELPTIPYFTAYEGAQQFNIPIPEGWSIQDNDADYVYLANEEVDADIYVFAEQMDSTEAAVEDAIGKIFPDAEAEQRLTGSVTLDGIPWDKTIYDIAGGGTVSTFSREQEGTYYMLAMVNRDPDEDFYIIAVETEDEASQDILKDTISELYSDFDTENEPVNTSEVRFNNVWTRSEFELGDDESLHTLHRSSQFNRTYAMIERGDGSLIDNIEQDFFTTLFGFFVTPQNRDFLYLGLAVTGGLMLLMVGSIWMRHRSLNRDQQLIQQLRDDN